MLTGATNMDSNIVELETDELLSNGSALPESVTEFFKERVLKKISTQQLETLAKYKAIAAGGCFLTLSHIKDVDLFFPTLAHANKCFREISGMYANHRKNNLQYYLADFPLEFIRFKSVETPQELFDTFDISIAQVAYDFASGTYHYSQIAADDLNHDQFSLCRVTNTLGKQMARIAKYRAKGYTINDSVWDVLKEASYLPDEELGKRFGSEYEEAKEQVDMFAPVVDNVGDWPNPVQRGAQMEAAVAPQRPRPAPMPQEPVFVNVGAQQAIFNAAQEAWFQVR